MSGRATAIGQIAAIICRDDLGHPTRVAVDGVTASGKSTLAREITAAVAAAGRPVIHLTMDGYHHRREHRYRQGRSSARGYYDDAYDFTAFADYVLIPLGAGGGWRYRERIIDLASDEPRDEPLIEAPADAVVVVDGSFLQRPELAMHWDHRVFVNTRLDVARSRGTTRDSELFGGRSQAEQIYDTRYHAAARLYLESVHPAEQATLIVDNDDLANPGIRTPPGDVMPGPSGGG
jgi:uridine kinase